MFLYMPPVLGLLQFTYSHKAAFTICLDLTIKFQAGMLSLPAFFFSVVLNAENVAASRELVSSAYKISIFSRRFSSVQLRFDSA